MRSTAGLVFLAASSNAFEWPFKLPWLASTAPDQVVFEAPSEPTAPTERPPRVAIIGAGAGGTSAAFWLSLSKQRANHTFEIDVYDRSDYVGGRSTTIQPYGNNELPQIELGGSIFVDANKNMVRAATEFGLDFGDSDFNHKHELGLWDGQQFVFRTETSGISSWWGSLKALWRYGYSAPAKVDSLVKAMLVDFLKLYDHDFGTWKDIPEVISKVKLSESVAQSGAEYLDSQGVGLKFSRELIDAATRVNYGQNLETIHGFGAVVSMSADKAYTVTSGNRKIFETFLQRSGANVLLNTQITRLTKKSNPPVWELTTTKGTAEYDAVIVSAPLASSGITFKPALKAKLPKVPYVNLHVTLLTTTAPHANPVYFGLAPKAKVPRMLLTTHDGARNGGRDPEFNSINYIRPLKEGGDEWVVKIFSNESRSDAWLEKVFDGKVGWVHRKIWEAYPRLDPRAPDSFPPLRLDDGLYYVNAFEPFVSTMETETIASRNVVELLLQEHFKSSICPTKSAVEATEGLEGAQATEPPATSVPADFVQGWDCLA
ncbi:FAD/NAD(P)-binding domain-containing protein [Auricularia subglabra TFB-10046 SS5]|nr:FAD/NAD(P)-binding domain-containing protein [Auricularia subglabra TFB-10046 SS5]